MEPDKPATAWSTASKRSALAFGAVLIGLTVWALWRPAQPSARKEPASEEPEDDTAAAVTVSTSTTTTTSTSTGAKTRPLGQGLDAPRPTLAPLPSRDPRAEFKFAPLRDGKQFVPDRFRAELAGRGLRWQIAAQQAAAQQAAPAKASEPAASAATPDNAQAPGEAN